jgi:hypothetical protein
MDGFYCLIALKLNKDSKVISVEPSPGAKELIQENLKLNGYNFNENILFSNKKIGKINDNETLSLSELAKDLSGTLFILIDIEGAEAEVLESSKGFLKNNKAYLLVETHSKELENKCLNLFAEFGYGVKIIRNAWWRFFLPEERRADHNRWIFAKNIA